MHAPRPAQLRGGAVLVVVVGVLLGAAGCSREPAADAPKGRVSVLTARRIIPKGELVLSAREAGAIVVQDVPADLAADDALTGIEEIRCLVAVTDLPQGAILRRGMFAPPAELGLPGGFTSDGSVVGSCA